MKFLQSKDIHFKYGIISLLLTILVFLLTTPFFFFKMMDISLGILLGGLYSSAFGFLFSYSEKRKMGFAIFVQICKTVLMGIIAVGLALLYVNGNFKVFNPFAFLASYAVLLIIYIIITRKDTKNE